MTDPAEYQPVAFTLMCPECETGKMTIKVQIDVRVSLITTTVPSLVWSRTVRGAEIVEGPDSVFPGDATIDAKHKIRCSNPECDSDDTTVAIAITKWREKGHPHLKPKDS